MNVSSIYSSHRRAEALIEKRHDAEQGIDTFSDSDASWLETHLADCDACRELLAVRPKLDEGFALLRGAEAPAGFADRVLRAARETPEEEVPEVVDEGRSLRGWATPILALAAAAALVFAVMKPNLQPDSNVEVSGPAVISATNKVDFVVRSPGLGAAKARALIERAVLRHGGSVDVRDNVALARVPRAGLVSLMQDLANQGRFKMTRTDAGELGADRDVVFMQFELE